MVFAYQTVSFVMVSIAVVTTAMKKIAVSTCILFTSSTIYSVHNMKKYRKITNIYLVTSIPGLPHPNITSHVILKKNRAVAIRPGKVLQLGDGDWERGWDHASMSYSLEHWTLIRCFS